MSLYLFFYFFGLVHMNVEWIFSSATHTIQKMICFRIGRCLLCYTFVFFFLAFIRRINAVRLYINAHVWCVFAKIVLLVWVKHMTCYLPETHIHHFILHTFTSSKHCGKSHIIFVGSLCKGSVNGSIDKWFYIIPYGGAQLCAKTYSYFFFIHVLMPI